MKNFSISVCYFHLNQTLAEPIDRVSPEADLIWENLIKLSEKLPFTELKELKSKLVCYELGSAAKVRLLLSLILIQKGLHRMASLVMQDYKKSNVFQHKTEALNLINIWLTEEQKPIKLTAIGQNELKISGKLQPFLLHDTYAFDLTLFPENIDRDITLQELNLFQPDSLFLDCSENTLGETIWLSGQAEIGDTECQYLADKLVKEFLEDTKFTARLVDEGKLLQVPLFQYEISQKNQPKKLYKILVWIDNKAINQKLSQFMTICLGHSGLITKLLMPTNKGEKVIVKPEKFIVN